jgi:hypothetical protein
LTADGVAETIAAPFVPRRHPHATDDAQPARAVPRRCRGGSGGVLGLAGAGRGAPRPHPPPGHRGAAKADFAGFSAVAFHVGTATARDGTVYNLETDLRTFRGNYVDATGARRFGTFAFI